MPVNHLHIALLIKGVMDGSVEIINALPIARQLPGAAAHEAKMHWPDLRKDRRVSDERANRLGEFLWQLLGCTKALQEGFDDIREDVVAQRIISMHLASEPDVFTDFDLTYLGSCEDHGLRQAVKQVQARRLNDMGRRLKDQPVELSQDVRKVQQRVSEYNFHPDLNALLDKVEDGMMVAGDQFDQSALLKHLRTFFEQLHQHVAECLMTRRPLLADGTDLTKCGEALHYLQRKGVLTLAMKDIGKGLYGVLSNQGVHAIKAEREYVRLCRNMVTEYALVLFYELAGRLGKP